MSSDLTQPKPPVLVLGKGHTIAALEPGTEHRFSGRMVDLCFVFDTTGSMSDKIDGLVESMVHFVHELGELSLDWRVTVVPFGDLTVPGDRIVADLPLVAEQEAAERLLRAMPRNDGGGNTGESVLEAVRAALSKQYRPGAVKVFVVLTDEPALQGRLTTSSVEKELLRSEVVTFVASPPESYYRRWAEVTGGAWFEIGPTLDYGSILSMLRGLAQRVALVASSVHALADGSVSRYLALPPPQRGQLTRRAP